MNMGGFLAHHIRLWTKFCLLHCFIIDSKSMDYTVFLSLQLLSFLSVSCTLMHRRLLVLLPNHFFVAFNGFGVELSFVGIRVNLGLN